MFSARDPDNGLGSEIRSGFAMLTAELRFGGGARVELRSCMDEHRLIYLKEYFTLVAELHSTNAVKNQTIETYFFLKDVDDHEELFMAITEWQTRVLCQRVNKNQWLPLGFTPYDTLEKYFCEILYDWPRNMDLTKYIKSRLFKLGD